MNSTIHGDFEYDSFLLVFSNKEGWSFPTCVILYVFCTKVLSKHYVLPVHLWWIKYDFGSRTFRKATTKSLSIKSRCLVVKKQKRTDKTKPTKKTSWKNWLSFVSMSYWSGLVLDFEKKKRLKPVWFWSKYNERIWTTPKQIPRTHNPSNPNNALLNRLITSVSLTQFCLF